MEKDSRITQLQKYFKVGVSKSAPREEKLKILKQRLTTEGGMKVSEEIFSPRVQRLFDYYMNNCHAAIETYETMKEVFEDMEMLFYESTLMSRAMKLTAEEVHQADSNNRVLGVEAKRDQKKFINEFLLETDLEEYIPATTLDIIQFGNAGWIPVLDDRGVSEITPVNIYDMKQRIEFTPVEVEKQMLGKTGMIYALCSLQRMQHLINSILNKDNYASHFKSYLLGFQIGHEYVLPPWRFVHFRNQTNKSPFTPWGMPMYIHAVSAYRQLDAAKTLRVAALGAQFPVDVYTVETTPGQSATDKFIYAADFLKQLDNSGMHSTKKEGIGVGERIITIKDLFDYQQISPSVSLNNFEDMEMLRDDLILATGLPRNYLDPNNGNFGNSGVALAQQFRPFARAIYQVQKILMSGISQLIKVHMIQSGKYQIKDIDFQLTMPYPESQVDRDLISSQSDLIRLATDVMDALKDKLVGDDMDDKLPVSVIQDIFSQILPYDQNRLDAWFKEIEKDKKAKGDDEGDASDIVFEKKLKKKIGYSGFQDLLEETIHNQKQKNYMTEGVMGGQHYFSSMKKFKDFDIKYLIEFKKDDVKKLQEKFDDEVKKEENPYQYKSEEGSYKYKSRMYAEELELEFTPVEVVEEEPQETTDKEFDQELIDDINNLGEEQLRNE